MTRHTSNIYRNYISLKSSTSVRQGLVSIAASYFMQNEDALGLADEIIRQVEATYQPAGVLRPCTTKAMNSFYQNELDPREADARIFILDRMIFALDFFEDPVRLTALEEGIPLKVLYPETDEEPDCSLQNEIRLRDALAERIERLHLSPGSMDTMLKLLASDHHYLSNASFLGYDVFQFRCAAAIQLCLSEGMSPAKAAETAAHIPYPLWLEPFAAKAATCLLFIVMLFCVLFMTKYLMDLYDLSLFWAEGISILLGAVYYAAAIPYKEKLDLLLGAAAAPFFYRIRPVSYALPAKAGK